MGEAEVGRAENTPAESAGSPNVPRRRRRPGRPDNLAQARLRKFYFSMAAFWGFLIGTVAVLAGLVALGRPLRLAPIVAFVLIGAAIVAVVGGLIASLAYREASKRLR